MDTLTFAHQIVDALEEHKGENIILLDIHNLAPFADYFIICSGSNDRLVDALAKTALDTGREAHIHGRVEGSARSGWVLIDFGEVVVHVFAPEMRDYTAWKTFGLKARPCYTFNNPLCQPEGHLPKFSPQKLDASPRLW